MKESLYDVLGTPQRIRILRFIGSHKPFTIYLWNICLALKFHQGRVSNHVKYLRKDGLIKIRQEHKKRYVALTEKGSQVYILLEELFRILK